MITAPEQMREAARDNDLIRRGEAFEAAEVCTCGDCYTDTYRAIRAIPIAPQPVAVTVKPLVWDGHVAHTTFGSYAVHDCRGYGQTYRLRLPMGVEGHTVLSHCSELMFTTQELAKAAAQADYEARILSALTIQPADPLSDPRVVALVKAAKGLLLAHDYGSGLEGWYNVRERLRAALRAIGGEA